MIINRIKQYYNWGSRFLNNKYNIEGNVITLKEIEKPVKRYDIINYILLSRTDTTSYLEIGVRRPEDNFLKIKADIKYSVDPGFENNENPVDFPLTSDEFFSKMDKNDLEIASKKFDVIFIDGLHTAEQTYRDILNSLKYLKDDGYIVMHDCNPPTEWHARESYNYDLSPAKKYWNGTTWKAFYKIRFSELLTSICIDTDWGVGIISKQPIFNSLNESKDINPFFEYQVFALHREHSLNLVSFESFKQVFEGFEK